MNNIGLTKEIIHPQWGAPMSYHRIVRVETDMVSKQTYIVFSSYYSQAVYEGNGQAMSTNTIHIEDSVLRIERDLLQAIIDSPDNVLSGGTIVVTGAAT